jgi:hypothetical protein
MKSFGRIVTFSGLEAHCLLARHLHPPEQEPQTKISMAVDPGEILLAA